MEPLAAGVTTLLIVTALTSAATVGFVVYDRRRVPSSDLYIVSTTTRRGRRASRLSTKQSSRWMFVGWLVFVVSVGLLVALLWPPSG